MEFIWSPWRYDYMASAESREVPRPCVFCIGEDRTQDSGRLVLFRGNQNFIILNLFPYTSGHLMIAPYVHLSSVVDSTTAQTAEMMDLAKRAIAALTTVYHPEGFNIGMNLGH